MDVSTLYQLALDHFGARVREIGPEHWDLPTPCADWTVRDLVQHVTYENVWTVPLVEGATIDEVGDRFERDLLGDRPARSALAAIDAAAAAMAARLPGGGTVQLSFGETPLTEYALQLAADHLVHGWDLAVAVDGETALDAEAVLMIADWFDGQEEAYRGAGAIAPRRPVTGDAQHDLLARFGRDPGWGANHRTLARFNAAFGAADLERALALVTDDVIFESTAPAPDGRRHEGRAAVRTAWVDVMGTPGMTFTEEESFVAGDRGVVRWSYAWGGPAPGHVRGVDVLRFRDGLISEKFSYVKG